MTDESVDLSFLPEILDEDQFTFADSDTESHSTDWGTEDFSDTVPGPDAVVYPKDTQDVSRLLRQANDRNIPVTPYAAGTSLEGNAVPIDGGISLDMTRMNSVLDVRPDDFQIDVEPGIIGTEVNEAVKPEGLFFPPLPSSGSISTIGGMIANDAGGMQTVKYGKVGDWVLELKAVLADGSVVEFGSKAVKTSSGYNLRDLLVGSEGTLGVVTRATLELKGIPQQKRGGRAIFPDVDSAASAVFDAVRSEVDVAKIELIDDLAATMVNDYLGTDLPDSPMVFVEFHANHGVGEEVEFARSVFESHDVEEFEVGNEDEMERLWELRRELAYAVRSYDPDLAPINPGDVTVPISKYPEMVKLIKSLGEENGIPIPCFGHAGDGNVHYAVLVDRDDDEERRKGEEVYEKVVEKALDFGGTATGEHGVGLGKRKFMRDEHGRGVEAMRSVKEALDPNGILNPGKVFPGEREEFSLRNLE